MGDLGRKAILGLAQLTIVLASLLFALAGTFDFWQAWLFLVVFVGSAAAITVYLWANDPALLKRRVKAGPGAERERSQNVIQILASLAFIGIVAFPALDRRFGWSTVRPAIVLFGDFLVALGFLIVFLTFRANTFSAGTIEIESGQTVISSGPYAFVRHPMYAGALIMLAGTPLALGSWWGLLMLVPMKLIILWRLLDEERYLTKNLSGYAEYCEKVRYRLAPLIW
jgi:protein-S-isoprenylcysteine O-methyltransferase Ste14